MDASTANSVEIAPGVTLDLVLVHPGNFQMGSRESESAQPVHAVEITTAFQMAKFPVTQEQYQAVMAPASNQPKTLKDRLAEIFRSRISSTPSQFKGHLKNPVEMVSWNDAQEFCKRFGVLIKRSVMLPTESQWEYACRAGTTTRFYVGETESDLNRAGWHSGNSGYRPHDVGQKEPNAWGLYDMHGNVWEWCHDWHNNKYAGESPQSDPTGPQTGVHKVMRGGSWYFAPEHCTSAIRGWLVPGGKRDNVGFRIVVLDESVPCLQHDTNDPKVEMVEDIAEHVSL